MRSNLRASASILTRAVPPPFLEPADEVAFPLAFLKGTAFFAAFMITTAVASNMLLSAAGLHPPSLLFHVLIIGYAVVFALGAEAVRTMFAAGKRDRTGYCAVPQTEPPA